MVKRRKRITKQNRFWSNTIKILILLVLLILVVTYLQGKTILEPNTNQTSNTTEEENMSNIVTIKTNKGIIKAELYTEKAPITTANFIKLTNQDFYDGLTFHRYEPGFVIQGGDPKGDGTGGSGETIPLEIVPELKHVEGALAMARTNDPNSATSQFYITLAPTPFLDGNYAVFGKVIEGMDVVLQLRAGDVMEEVTYQE